MSTDPFGRLGLAPTASADEVRRARRELAKQAHPDVGGAADEMQAINDAAAAALRRIADGERQGDPRPDRQGAAGAPGSDAAGDRTIVPEPDRHGAGEPGSRHRRDMPSFSVEALPAETFEALLIAAAALGEVEDDDPPYLLDVLMAPPLSCWCRLTVVPDAGASTVGLAIAADVGRTVPPIERVRDAWIDELNGLDWAQLD